MSLRGRRILIVRPVPESGKGGGDSFVSHLKNAGAQVLHYPVMTLTSFYAGPEAEQVKASVRKLDHYDALIFVSRTAALLGAVWLHRYWPQLPANINVFSIGKSTAGVLADANIKACCPDADMTSEGLLELPDLQNMRNRRVLIFRGEGGRETLARELQARGGEVSYVELYRRETTRQHQSDIGVALAAGVDAIAVHSGELLWELLKIVDELKADIQKTPVVVPGERVAELAGRAGLKNVIVADNAMPQSMVSALNGWYI